MIQINMRYIVLDREDLMSENNPQVSVSKKIVCDGVNLTTTNREVVQSPYASTQS